MTRSRPLASLIALALVAAACGADAPTAPGLGGSPAIRVVDAPGLPATVDELPDVDPDGYEALLAELTGTPVVVNFWATWCGPCVREMPMLADAARRLDTQVQFVGVNILDNRDAARTFLGDVGTPYPNLFDANGLVRTSVGSIGQPVTIFYAADGSQAAKVDGELSQADLKAHLAELTG